VTRAKIQCALCGNVWYWHRQIFQQYALCPECGTARISKLAKYDKIDRVSKSMVRHIMGLFRATIYHCTFCRLQFRDHRELDPGRKAKVQV
jgi:DNA-directed RNA polymerase subunit RPC12/RpoP